MLKVFLRESVYMPGETVRGHVEVHWKRKKKVRGIHISLVGSEETRIRVSTGSGESRSSRTYRQSNRIIGEEIRLWGGGRVGWFKAMGEGLARPFKKLDYAFLPAGRHRYPFSFQLPSRALPSFSGQYATVEYCLDAQVDVPLGRDKTFNGIIQVIPRPSTRLKPVRLRKKPRTSWLSRAYKASLDMEMKTRTCRLVPDEPLEGTLTVRNRSKKKIRGFRIILSGVEYARAGGYRRDQTYILEKGYLRAPDPSAKRLHVKFGIKIPWDSFPYKGRYSRFAWRLALQLDIARGFDAEIRPDSSIRWTLPPCANWCCVVS